MSHTITWIDKLRIERVVWALDQQLYDLPRVARIATRREVRENLRAAATDVGTTAAIRRLGSSRRLANEYLASEFGPGPRHSWMAAAYFAASVPFVLTLLLDRASNAFRDGVLAANPNATGSFTWHGIGYLQRSVTYTFTNGTSSAVGGDWVSRPVPWVILVAGTILVGRLWRMFPSRRNRSTAPTAV